MSGPSFCKFWTLDAILAERVEEEGNCWLWMGAMSGPKSTTPTMWFRGRQTPAYAVTWMLSKGLCEVPKGLSLWRGCRNVRCISPACIKSGSPAQHRKWLTEQGAYVCTPARKAAITAKARKACAKLKGGMEEARAIRASDDTEKALSERHGISISRVNRIRNGKAWCETVLPGASIFSMGACA